jgi:hypothetical protein
LAKEIKKHEKKACRRAESSSSEAVDSRLDFEEWQG